MNALNMTCVFLGQKTFLLSYYVHINIQNIHIQNINHCTNNLMLAEVKSTYDCRGYLNIHPALIITPWSCLKLYVFLWRLSGVSTYQQPILTHTEALVS